MNELASSDPPEARRLHPLSPLGNPLFRRFWAASMFSNVGGMIQSVAAAWLMTSITPHTEMVALVQTAVMLPMMLFSLPAGALADIVDRRMLMLVAQGAMLVISVVLAALSFLHLTTPAILLLSTFLLGCGAAFYAPAWQSSIIEQVPPGSLDQAIAINSVGFNVARSLGPALGGAIVAATSAATAFVVNAFSYIGLLVTLLFWQRPVQERPLPPETFGNAITTGVRYVWLSPALLAILVRGAAFGLCGSGIAALAPLLAKGVLTGGPLTYGLLLGGFGTGAIGGAVARTLIPASRTAMLRYCTIIFGVAAILLGLSTSIWLSLPLMALAGAAWVVTLTNLSVAVQLVTPRWVVGRAISINQMSVFAGLAAGSALWGYIARHIGVESALMLSGLAMLASLLLGFRFYMRIEEQPDLSPVRLRPIDDLSGPIGHSEGPIVVTIEYRVPEGNRAAFAAAMDEIGRIRRRDGAHRWSLLQDANDPGRWLERFHSPTWLDHLRRQTRSTIADQAVRDRVRALHEGNTLVTRMIQRGDGTGSRIPTPTSPPTGPY